MLLRKRNESAQALTASHLRQASRDSNEMVRAHAMRLAASVPTVASEILRVGAGDSDLRVRYAAAQTSAGGCPFMTTFDLRDADYTAAIAGHWPELIAVMLDRVDAYRDRNGNNRFYDMAYRDLVGDPVGAVHGLYNHFGMAWTDETERSLREHASVHRQNRFGEHTYTLEEFGLEADAIRARLSQYLDRFGDYV